ncbi:MAG TPA: hypothetical protein VLT33_25875, partial [Labilithrix sp.]|nr:hypothetical protein [Labilithrix sp.]
TVSASSNATLVPAPDYTMVDGTTVTVDAARLVTGQGGQLTLTSGSVTGETYSVYGGAAAGTRFDDIDAAYVAGTKTAIAGTIAVAKLNLTGVTLPVIRTVVIQHAVSGVVSYESFQITYDGP